jgi:YD repeat-containing protein
VTRLTHARLISQGRHTIFITTKARTWAISGDRSGPNQIDKHNATTYGYDDAGRQVTETDPNSHTTTTSYNADGSVASITDALSGVVHFGYDAAGQQTSLTDARGKTSTMTCDALVDVLSQTDPLHRTTTNQYDLLGTLTQTTDARGVVTGFVYDAAGNQTSETYPGGGSVSWAYDALGRRSSMTDVTGTTSWGYDAANRVTSVAAPQGGVSYSYNPDGSRASMTLPGGKTVSYSYDGDGRLSGVSDWLSRTISLSYTVDGLEAGITRPDGVVTTNSYDAAGRLTGISHTGPGNTSLRHFTYTLDAAGNRTAVVSDAGTESYTLDAVNRITNVTYPQGDTASYSYDANGNRLTKTTTQGGTATYAYDDADQLLSDGTNSYSYDQNGNLLGAGSGVLSWDYANRLATAQVGSTTARATPMMGTGRAPARRSTGSPPPTSGTVVRGCRWSPQTGRPVTSPTSPAACWAKAGGRAGFCGPAKGGDSWARGKWAWRFPDRPSHGGSGRGQARGSRRRDACRRDRRRRGRVRGDAVLDVLGVLAPELARRFILRASCLRAGQLVTLPDRVHRVANRIRWARRRRPRCRHANRPAGCRRRPGDHDHRLRRCRPVRRLQRRLLQRLPASGSLRREEVGEEGARSHARDEPDDQRQARPAPLRRDRAAQAGCAGARREFGSPRAGAFGEFVRRLPLHELARALAGPRCQVAGAVDGALDQVAEVNAGVRGEIKQRVGEPGLRQRLQGPLNPRARRLEQTGRA